MSKANPMVVLCVDDDPAGLMARRLVLSIAGYDVLTATSGEAALWILRTSHVDMVITDHFLSGFEGVEILASIKRTKPAILVVLLTATPVLPPGAEMADLVLIKGIAPPEFLAAIAKLAEGRHGSAEGNRRGNGGSR